MYLYFNYGNRIPLSNAGEINLKDKYSGDINEKYKRLWDGYYECPEHVFVMSDNKVMKMKTDDLCLFNQFRKQLNQQWQMISYANQ